MRLSARQPSYLAALLLIVILLSNTIAYAAPKPLTPAETKLKIEKFGVNHYVRVVEGNGIDLHGRILAVNDQSFQMQLWNQPQPTDIRYDQVTELHNLGWTKGKTAILVGGLGAVVGLSVYGFVHLHNLQNQPLQTPAFP